MSQLPQLIVILLVLVILVAGCMLLTVWLLDDGDNPQGYVKASDFCAGQGYLFGTEEWSQCMAQFGY